MKRITSICGIRQRHDKQNYIAKKFSAQAQRTSTPRQLASQNPSEMGKQYVINQNNNY